MLKVLKSGFYTSIQDKGRFGYLDKGVPSSGVMDGFSASIVNHLLENNETDAVLEITMTGPTLQFKGDTYICIGGAAFSVTLNNIPIRNYKVYKVVKGDILSFGKLEKGIRAYLGVKDGFLVDKVLGSRSFYKTITGKLSLEDSDQIPYSFTSEFSPKLQDVRIASVLEEQVIEVYKGPEFSLLTDKHFEHLFSKNFSIAKENNRMAYQLQESILGHQLSILTSATLPGTVQLTPSGKIIILMRDGQTTGGYPRVLQLSEKSISVLAQKKQGDAISFKLLMY